MRSTRPRGTLGLPARAKPVAYSPALRCATAAFLAAGFLPLPRFTRLAATVPPRIARPYTQTARAGLEAPCRSCRVVTASGAWVGDALEPSTQGKITASRTKTAKHAPVRASYASPESRGDKV